MLRVAVGAKRTIASARGARLASTATTNRPEVFSPAVAYLLANHHIDRDTAVRIPRTGPKNRLLKGDVLAFIKDPSTLGTSAAAADETELELHTAQFERIISLSQVADLSAKGFQVGDIFARAASLALQAVPEVNARWSQKKEVVPAAQIVVQKINDRGASYAVLDVSPKLTLAKVAKSLQAAKSTRPKTISGAFSLYDQSSASLKLLPDYLTAHEPTALLIVEEVRAPRIAKADAAFDFLTGSRQTVLSPLSSASKGSRSADLLDYLAKPAAPSAAALEARVTLSVDGRAVSPAVASKFLNILSSFILTPKKL
ncbi:uncharacterized protein BJ171DRAFT_484998 [Polychytrium aggregatum]|uniref:uncharacterized protein n=1 Tax=Polychytrium aggregatum TaxID=110093 RepID=UPI0022FDBDEF|nr:uncharacterized protein BJ171DRAFT_484998 [Polychytrium aggregatum]KAI9209777.1 hypothetical protein BJ171DRAFT_484998 [Polychytrium aggregatum]